MRDVSKMGKSMFPLGDISNMIDEEFLEHLKKII